MKIHIILYFCVCNSLAVIVDYEKTKSTNIKGFLVDIRQVSTNKTESPQKSGVVKEQNQFLKQTSTTMRSKVVRQGLRKSLEKNKKTGLAPTARIGDSQIDNSSNEAQMQKIANQLYLAQKRVSLLSDYQKFILSQDANVRNFVLEQSKQNRNFIKNFPKRLSGRSFPTFQKVKYIRSELPKAESIDLGKIVVVTPKVQTAVEKISKPQNDHKTQETHIKYVTLSPQSLTHYAETHKPIQKVTLMPYYKPQKFTYYDLEATSKSQVEAAQIQASAVPELASYKLLQSQYHKDKVYHEDSVNYDNAKYEFMYKVNDQEKNNHFGHKESRSDKTTYGYYFVQLPDGRLETVKYWADKSGYHAKVDYQGQAEHLTNTEHK